MADGPAGLFGRSGAAAQLFEWQVLAQALAAVLGPTFQLLAREANKALPAMPLSGPELADMVVRHIVEEGPATDYARESGLAAADFRRMVQAAGEGPAPGDLAEALRRGIIAAEGTGPDSTSFQQGIAESHLRDKWTAVVKALAVREPTPEDALAALLEGQLPEDQARALYVRFGGDPEHFQWLFDTRGSAPTPIEASDMANRGIIPWDGQGPDVVSYQQAFLEGPWRDKWSGPYRQLAEYRPPARTIVAMVRSGALTDDRALVLFKDLGMTADMAAAQLADAHHQKTAQDRELAKGDILALFADRVIGADKATEGLQLLGYSSEDAGFLLALQDARRAIALLKSATSRIGSLYVARKINKQTAAGALGALKVPPDQSDDLLQTWDIERQATVKVLSQAEVAAAYHYKLMDLETAIEELVGIGYTPYDAWVILSVREHEAQGPPPARGPVG